MNKNAMHKKITPLALALSVLLVQPALAAEPGKSKSLTELTQGLNHQPGLFDLWRDAENAKVLLAVRELDQPFLMLTSLPYGLGSNDVGLDRGQAGSARMVRFQKFGKKLFLVADNVNYVANAQNAAERAAATEAFASAVLWSGEVLASENGRHLIDVSSFLLADRHGIAQRIAGSRQGAYKVDDKRSAVLADQAKSFPDNTELEALLTFAGPGEGEYVRQVAADAENLSMRQHISFVRLPDNQYKPRTYHAGSGGFDSGYFDFSTPLAESLDVRWQVRHRLEKITPGSAPSPVKKPIVFYLDRGTPEPVRSALLDGARWWATAFEKAGFKEAYRVEMLPEDVDPMDVRYNTILWVHRATRGWSYGNAITDPRTGEIIKGAVTLGSQRVRQDILIAESLLAPYGKSGSAERKKAAEEMALARLRQLSAHEVGHTLGIAHNFAASRHGNGSVMDYPHPILKVNAQGQIDLNNAYGIGVGDWDDFVVHHLYGDFTGQDESKALADLRDGIYKKGYRYVSDTDARAPGAAHNDGLLWDFGPDTLKTWEQVLNVRSTALKQFSVDVLPPQRQIGELEARLVPLYLLHRYQAEGVARKIAGGEYDSLHAFDAQAQRNAAGLRVTPANEQRAALQALLKGLQAEQLALPANVLDILTPPSQGFDRTREYFATRMNVVFDALSAVEAGSAQILQFLLDPARLNRLAWQQSRDKQQLGLAETLNALLDATWKRAVPAKLVGGETVQLAANWVVVDALLNTLESGRLHPSVDADTRAVLAGFAQWCVNNPGSGVTNNSRLQAADLIKKYLADPRSVKLRGWPAIPPGAPI